jgi:SNF2 family DNA or RNA helicase
MFKPRNRREPVAIGWSLARNDFALFPAVECAASQGNRSDDNNRADSMQVGAAPLELSITEFAIRPTGVVSSPFEPPSVRTIGCSFESTIAGRTGRADGQEVRPQIVRQESQSAAVRTSLLSPPRPRYTRIRPPLDVVKLEDRLRLLLQPPLESLLREGVLRFARPPFGYQLDGIAFLYPRHEAVLADEMGLGKTMQAITAIRLMVHQGQLRRVLLVCPKPLVSNWQREFAQWAPELPVTSVEGGPARRQWLWREGGAVVRIANYEAVVRDQADVCDAANHYDLVVLDESQRIKNADSTTNKVVRSIPRSRSWALTGTPIENSVEDLAGIFEFVAPGRVDTTKKPRFVGRSVCDYMLRRTKDQVLSDLPPKLYRDAKLELSPEQAESYRLAEDKGVVRLREMKHELTIGHVFELVLRLKQICNFDPLTGASSKFERLEADLEECASSGRKAIVFSQWVETLLELRSRLTRFGPEEYHGKIAQRRRESAIARFRDDPGCHVILMTYGAGSVGLNLQFASYVFLFDRWWNPAVEEQAINRAHRIGAQRPVTVTRFLSIDTIEQRINQILERKRELFDTVFDASISAPSSGFSREEVFSLFNLDASGGAVCNVA